MKNYHETIRERNKLGKVVKCYEVQKDLMFIFIFQKSYIISKIIVAR